MNQESDDTRHSHAQDADLIDDPNLLAEAEARNGLRQYDLVLGLVADWTQPERTFKLRPSMLLSLHRVALEGINAYAGNYRPGPVKIGQSKHEPMPAHLVPEAVEALCDYVNEHWSDKSAIHLAAYMLWRLNWIHPFTDGNGRTARAASYLVLSIRIGYPLPGKNTVPEQIANNKTPYYEALEMADSASKQGTVDVGALEELLDGHLAAQLADVHRKAMGN